MQDLLQCLSPEKTVTLMKYCKISAPTESSRTKKFKRNAGPDLSSVPSKSWAVEKYPAVHPAGMAGA